MIKQSYKNVQGLKFNQLKQLQQLSRQFERTLACPDRALDYRVDDPIPWYDRAEALANLGCYTEALTCFNKVLEIQPDHPGAWVFRGVVLVLLHRYEEALISCDKALEIQPNNPEAWMFRGAALNHLGRYQEAYASYNQALGIENTPPWRKLLQWCKKLWWQTTNRVLQAGRCKPHSLK